MIVGVKIVFAQGHFDRTRVLANMQLFILDQVKNLYKLNCPSYSQPAIVFVDVLNHFLKSHFRRLDGLSYAYPVLTIWANSA